ncbi:MAG: GNAT family N-acetyltransferase [Candidatus Bathyarchaeota archaeon]|nr:MAG: GNAT family N-acetyltransferase [Candidatus Bathyarchaeota archaeon]
MRIHSGGNILVAEINNEIVGTVSGLEEHGSMHVCSLAVLPAHQNSGVARRLMERLETVGQEKGCCKLFLHTAWAMKEAIQLYEKLGYMKEGYLREHFYGEDFMVFSKFIKSSTPYLRVQANHSCVLNQQNKRKVHSSRG